jgi:pimeloyl-ACP methyl ester carboxylesterase
MIPAVGPLKRRAYPIRGVTEPGAPFAYVAAVQHLLARLDLDRAAAEVSAPVLLVYGSADRLVPAAQGRRLAELIPRSELLEIPGATHWGTAIAGPAIARIADWIEARTPSPGPRPLAPSTAE